MKLLDLGVARVFDVADGDEAAITDHNNLRPFVATAQYSSPEYLFRLDEPTPRLWKGLNFYQLGAVLHDLIMKSELFHDEVSLGNRWLVARAVLTKLPSFADLHPNRLASLKALASRCLVKDLDTRLQLVNWHDFVLEGTNDPLAELKGRIAKQGLGSLNPSRASHDDRLQFDRREFEKRFVDRIRSELISICETKLPLAVRSPMPNAPRIFRFELAPSEELTIHCSLAIEWRREIYNRTANVTMSSHIAVTAGGSLAHTPAPSLVCVAAIGEAEDQAVRSACCALAQAVTAGLDLIDSSNNRADLHGRYLYPVTPNTLEE